MPLIFVSFLFDVTGIQKLTFGAENDCCLDDDGTLSFFPRYFTQSTAVRVMMNISSTPPHTEPTMIITGRGFSGKLGTPSGEDKNTLKFSHRFEVCMHSLSCMLAILMAVYTLLNALEIKLIRYILKVIMHSKCHTNPIITRAVPASVDTGTKMTN